MPAPVYPHLARNGKNAADGRIEPHSHHYDGSSWGPMDAPDMPLLVWAHGFGANDVHAVGVDGGMAHFDGSAWSSIDTGTTEDLVRLVGDQRPRRARSLRKRKTRSALVPSIKAWG